MDTLVAAYPQQGAVHEADSGTFAKQTFLYEYHKLHDHRLFQFSESIVRNGFGKQVPAPEAYFVQIKVL